MKNKKTLNELRQVKEYIRPVKFTVKRGKEQTKRVKEKIEEIISTAHQKLNHGNSSEKMMAVGIIQLFNEMQLLTRECPNYYDLGKNVNNLFGINKRFK